MIIVFKWIDSFVSAHTKILSTLDSSLLGNKDLQNHNLKRCSVIISNFAV